MLQALKTVSWFGVFFEKATIRTSQSHFLLMKVISIKHTIFYTAFVSLYLYFIFLKDLKLALIK